MLLFGKYIKSHHLHFCGSPQCRNIAFRHPQTPVPMISSLKSHLVNGQLGNPKPGQSRKNCVRAEHQNVLEVPQNVCVRFNMVCTVLLDYTSVKDVFKCKLHIS